MSQSQLHEIIKNRKSPVIFSDKLIEQNKIDLLFEAARWAPSSMNEQPWRFIYVTNDNKSSFNKLYNCLIDGNKDWNANVPLLILGIAKNNFDYKDAPNAYAKYDIASAVANLTFQANSMDLWIHQMAGFDADSARREFSIPDAYNPVIVLSVGYLGSLEDAPEKLKNRQLAERKRKPANELVFKNTWNGR